jgi:outer membrane protein assembly factor BamB
MSRILAPVAAATYRNGHADWYGAVELDAETGEETWRFDAVQTDLSTAQLTQTGQTVTHSGFRPSSVQRLDDGRTLIAGWRRGVFVDEDGSVDETFSHELMNDTHEIQRTDAGTYLVAGTGLDSLVLLDEDFDERWRWHMWEHVDDATRPGNYYADRLWYRDARNLALNPDDRYHLNYATFVEGDGSGGDGTLLCSALNYGVFIVDVATGEITDEFTDLDECHNPYSLEDRLVVPESGADRVVAVDWEGRHETLFDGGLAFVKDADPIDDDRWLLTDTKNGRVLVWEEGQPQPEREFVLGPDTAPYEADYLPGSR